ncbi:MAG: hypothetical protein ABIF12_03250 [bacterium]
MITKKNRYFLYLFTILTILSYTTNFAQKQNKDKLKDQLEMQKAEILQAKKMANKYSELTKTEQNTVEQISKKAEEAEKTLEDYKIKLAITERMKDRAIVDKRNMLELAHHTFINNNKFTKMIEKTKQYADKKEEFAIQQLTVAKKIKQNALKKQHNAEKYYASIDQIIKNKEDEFKAKENILEENLKTTEIKLENIIANKQNKVQQLEKNYTVANQKIKELKLEKEILTAKNESYKIKLSQKSDQALEFKKEIDYFETQLTQTLGEFNLEPNITRMDYYVDGVVPHLVKTIRLVCKWLNKSVLDNKEYKIEKDLKVEDLLDKLNQSIKLSDNKIKDLAK